jgi:transcriptional regulator with XRE-family HTH domain
VPASEVRRFGGADSRRSCAGFARGRTGTEVATVLGWSPSKVSRYEQDRSTLPLDEVSELLDSYGVTELERDLLSRADHASQRSWWQDYTDALLEEYLAFIGLAAEAASVSHWQVNMVPGLLQPKEYARQLLIGYQRVVSIPPGVIERCVKARMIRQEGLVRDLPLQLSAVIDESVLLRRMDVLPLNAEGSLIEQVPSVRVFLVGVRIGDFDRPTDGSKKVEALCEAI